MCPPKMPVFVSKATTRPVPPVPVPRPGILLKCLCVYVYKQASFSHSSAAAFVSSPGLSYQNQCVSLSECHSTDDSSSCVVRTED